MSARLDRLRDAAPPAAVAAALAMAPAAAREPLERVWESRALVLRVTLAALALAALAAFLLPPVYVATTEVMDSSPTVSGSSLDRMSARLADLGLGSGAAGSAVASYPDVLRSRRLLTRLLEMPVRSTRGPSRPYLDVLAPRGPLGQRVERAVARMRRTMDVALDRKTGIVTLKVSAGDAQTAADLANGAVALLQQFVVESRSALAGENRRYLDQRLRETEAQLAGTEEALRAFRDANVRFGASPRLQLEEGRLERAVSVQQEVFITLNRERELANLDEHRDVSVLTVIDPAVPPALRSAPRRSLILLGGLVLGLALGAWLALDRSRRDVLARAA